MVSEMAIIEVVVVMNVKCGIHVDTNVIEKINA